MTKDASDLSGLVVMVNMGLLASEQSPATTGTFTTLSIEQRLTLLDRQIILPTKVSSLLPVGS